MEEKKFLKAVEMEVKQKMSIVVNKFGPIFPSDNWVLSAFSLEKNRSSIS